MSILKVNNIQQVSNDKLPQNLLPVPASAWMNYDGINNIIRDGHNVSSVVDNGVGDYVINFISNLDNTNYSFTGAGGDSSGGQAAAVWLGGNVSLSGLPVKVSNIAGTLQDREVVCVQMFGGQS